MAGGSGAGGAKLQQNPYRGDMHQQWQLINVEGENTEGENGMSTAAPAGYDQYRDNIPRGTIETVKYVSRTVGNERQAMIYTPPGYSKDNVYNVLYLSGEMRANGTVMEVPR